LGFTRKRRGYRLKMISKRVSGMGLFMSLEGFKNDFNRPEERKGTGSLLAVKKTPKKTKKTNHKPKKKTTPQKNHKKKKKNTEKTHQNQNTTKKKENKQHRASYRNSTFFAERRGSLERKEIQGIGMKFSGSALYWRSGFSLN